MPAISTRIRHNPAGQAKGQRRHDTRAGDMPAYVDASRTAGNSELIPPMMEAALRDECQRRRTVRGLRAMARNSAIATVGIITYSTDAQPIVEALPRDEQDRLIRATAEALAAEMGTTLTGLVVHRDESAIHAHYQMPAIRLDGHPVSKRVDTRRLQDVAAEPWAHLGITRGKPKAERQARGEDASAWVHRSVRRLHDDLPAEIEAAKAKVAAAEEKARVAADRLAKAEAKAEAAEGQVEQLQRRVETYERRAADAQAALQAARTEIDRLRGLLPDPRPIRYEVPREETRQLRDGLLSGPRPVQVVTGTARRCTRAKYYTEADAEGLAAAARERVARELQAAEAEREELRQMRQMWSIVTIEHHGGQPLERVAHDIKVERERERELRELECGERWARERWGGDEEAEKAKQQPPPQQPTPQPPPNTNTGPRM